MRWSGDRAARRIVLWAGGTAVSVVLLFGYHTSTAGTGGSGRATTGQRPVTAGTGAGGAPVTGDVVSTQWGPVQVEVTTVGSRITQVAAIRYPAGTERDVAINDRALPILLRETLDAQSADVDAVSGATVTSDGYRTSLQSALDHAGGGTARAVEQVMGMPVSLALRGSHAHDAAGRDAWRQAVATLRDVDRVFSPYRPDSVVARIASGELTIADGVAEQPELAEVLALGEQAREQSDGAFDVRRTPRGFDPSGVVKGWAAERAFRPLRALAGTDVCLSVGGDVICRVGGPASPDWRIGVEDPHDPTRVLAVVAVRDGAVATSGLTHRGAHVVDARTGAAPRDVAAVTVVAADLTWADLDATAALARDADARRWLARRVGRTGLVVRTDGRAEVLG